MTDLVADIDEDDVGGGIEREDIGADPLRGDVEIGGEGWEISIGYSDDDSDAGSGQGLDDGGICAV